MASPRRRTDPQAGSAALDRVITATGSGTSPARDDLRTAVRFLLEELAVRAPGRSVEVRVPPHGVVQCVEGPRHTRGTPGSVVETDAQTWIALATGRLHWSEAETSGRLVASGERSDLSGLLPLR